MELPAVKAAVKAWEKEFKARHGRTPGPKDDIKQDPTGIGMLQKETIANLQPSSMLFIANSPRARMRQTQSHTQPHSSTSTPLNCTTDGYPATPTPPARKPVNLVRPQTNLRSNVPDKITEKDSLQSIVALHLLSLHPLGRLL